MLRRDVGNRGEDMVVDYLRMHNYAVVARNYQQRCGEIDIIAQKNNRLFFIEVKMRSTVGPFDLAEVVNFTKQRRLIKTAQYYLMEHQHEDIDCQFDVALIEPHDGQLQLTYLSDAFCPE